MLLTFGAFAAWTLIGLGLLTALRADMRALPLVLTAPVLGACVVTVLVFILSRAGLAVQDFAVPMTATLLVASGALFAWRRTPLEWRAGLPFAIACAAMLLAGWPMFDLGFRWIANANDDMANYVLAAERLLRASFSAPLDVDTFVAGRDYSIAAQSFQAAGMRPGSQLALAWFQGVSGRSGQEAFMPLIVALHGASLCAVAALAAHATRRRVLAAGLAAAILAVAPLATWGVLQQLIAQTFGLGIAAALAAVLMRPELHERGPLVREVVLIGTLTASLALIYIEVGSVVFVAYAAYVIALAARRQIRWQTAARLWAGVVVVALLLLNTYAVSLASFLEAQAGAGTASGGDTPLFGFMFLPSAVPAVVGLRQLPFDGFDYLSWWILASIVALGAALVTAGVIALRGRAAAFIVLVAAGLGILLMISRADFGLFKLAMWAQPFIAATLAIGIAEARRREVYLAAAGALVLWLFPALETQGDYRSASRDPIELRHGSSPTVFPAFRRMVEEARGPVISATANPVLAKLEASMALGRQVFFLGREMFGPVMEQLAGIDVGGTRFGRESRAAIRRSQWTRRVFQLPPAGRGPRVNPFLENQFARAAFKRPGCTLILATGTQTVLNRRPLPDGMRDLVARPCASVRNVLVFVSSELGQNYYLPLTRRAISLYQLENDVYFSGTFSGAGRYALFQLLGPRRHQRVCVTLTRTLARDGANRIPPVTVTGSIRATFPTLGRGSARVCSARVSPRRIGGQSYVMLDMGVDGRPPLIPRPGLLGLYGEGFALDPRHLTSYVRDISVVTESEYATFRPPRALSGFPQALENQDLEYSGIYEDGWVGERSYALLAPGPAADLVVEGETYGAARQLALYVDGRRLARRRVGPGEFKLRMGSRASARRRRVELRFSSTAFLPTPDGRPVSARLSFLGFVP